MSRERAAEIMNSVNKALKTDALQLGSNEKYETTFYPTGQLPFDILFSGGIPKGRFSMLGGDYATLKTYVGMSTIKQVQAEGGVAAIIDAEHAYSEDWARSLGIDTGALIVERPETGEVAVDTTQALILAGVDYVLFDSVAAMLPQAEADKRLAGESVQPARIAQLMSVACRRLTATNKKTALVWINQYRTNIGMTFGSKDTFTGGRALPYYSSMTASVKKVGKLTRDIKFYNGQKWEDGKETIVQKYKVTLEKSRISAPFKDMVFDWDLESAKIDMEGFIIAQGLELGLITIGDPETGKGNTWRFTPRDKDGVVGEEFKAASTAKFRELVTDTPEVRAALLDSVTSFYGLVNIYG